MRASEEVPFATWLEQRARHGGAVFAPIGAVEAKSARVATRITLPRPRRRLFWCGFATLGAVALIIVVTTSLWPSDTDGGQATTPPSESARPAVMGLYGDSATPSPTHLSLIHI